MKFKLNIIYSEEELKFIKEHHYIILSEIKLSKINFYPLRMLKYGGTYIAEICDNESDDLV